MEETRLKERKTHIIKLYVSKMKNKFHRGLEERPMWLGKTGKALQAAGIFQILSNLIVFICNYVEQSFFSFVVVNL